MGNGTSTPAPDTFYSTHYSSAFVCGNFKLTNLKFIGNDCTFDVTMTNTGLYRNGTTRHLNFKGVTSRDNENTVISAKAVMDNGIISVNVTNQHMSNNAGLYTGKYSLSNPVDEGLLSCQTGN